MGLIFADGGSLELDRVLHDSRENPAIRCMNSYLPISEFFIIYLGLL